MKKQSGFTLIELLICVAIFGILAAVALPIILGVDSYSQSSSQGFTYSISAGAIEKRCESGTMYLVTSRDITPMLGPNGLPTKC